MLIRFIKRIEDIVLSLLVIIIFSPILIIVSILLFLLEGYPIFYISKRMIGINKTIRIIKFRTMVKDAESSKYSLDKKYMQAGYLDIPLSSEVYTPIGKLLERTQIVEVPQMIHILLGHLSFIGNRPLPRKNVEILKEEFPNDWNKRFNSPAGLTGISQIVGKFILTPEQRLELETLYSKVYQEGNILKADAYIFFSTIILLLLHDSVAYRSFESAKNILLSCFKK